MHSVGRAIVVILALGLVLTSYCAEACAGPQPTASECPQHQHSHDSDCCKHPSNDLAMTERVVSALEFKSVLVLFPPIQTVTTVEMIGWEQLPHPRLTPFDSVPLPSRTDSSSALRI